ALTADAAQYGQDASVQLRACRNYPNAGTICQSTWSAAFPLGTPVDPQINGLAFRLTGDGVIDRSGTFTWVNWPIGASYEGIEYRCGDTPGGPFSPATTSDAGSCQADGLVGAPTLTIRVVANGGQLYDITYDTSGNVQ
ncbi:MAG TPA: hypothetical protein DCP11_06715, partial [Microbacteriaceae bacterium]|nr:hypothetical protein [Microbacteriaceae bacterium]